MDEAVLRLAEAKGVLPRFTDVTGTLRETSVETARALLKALGSPVDNSQDATHQLAEIEQQRAARFLPPWMVVEAGVPPLIQGFNGLWRLDYEDGQSAEGKGDLPALPIGIHSLWISGQKTVLLAAPLRLALPDPGWGLMVPLWGLRGCEAGGLGDYADLEALGQSLGSRGPGFLGINPIHAGFPTVDTAYSPYQPSHRRRLNTHHIPLASAASIGDLVDYPAEFSLRRQALEAEFSAFEDDPRFEAFRAGEGTALELFARHQTLAEAHGPYWTDWPTELRSPRASEAADPTRVRFHIWAQWRADMALGAAQTAAKTAGLTHGLYLDLAVGTHPAGAETWEDAESFVRGVSLGAPPDALGPEGQVWNLAPFQPDALIENDFQVLAETLRCQFRHCGILRIDHILGFDRAFWVPENGAPGGYVRMPRDAMLAVARIEAARAGAVIVGEDLGVVPDGLRGALEASGILGCRVAMFEREGQEFRPAEHYPEAAIASFSTHDLPNWAGWRTGQDLTDWAELDVLSSDALAAGMAARAGEVAAFDRATGESAEPDSTGALHQFLARSRSRLIAVQAETLLDMRAQPNMPGTVSEYPNWRRRLPVPATEITELPSFIETVSLMKAAGRGGH